MTGRFTRAFWICILYCISGCAGLIYETVWIRSFALSFGNTLLSFSTVISVFLGGLALGAAFGGRLRTDRPLLFYGVAELWISAYALAIPWLMDFSPGLLAPLYGITGEGAASVAFARALLCALILLPATIPMGAGLPWLLSALAAEGPRAPRLIWVYALNTVGGAAGAISAGLLLLPAIGYRSTLITASSLDAAVGLGAIWLTRAVLAPISASTRTAQQRPEGGLPFRTLAAVTFFSGWTAMLYEVASARVAGLVFGPTAATVTLTLAIVLLGLAAGGILASLISTSIVEWLSASQLAVSALLLIASYSIAASPDWLAEELRLNHGSAGQIEFLEAGLLFLLLFPIMTAAGLALPLAMSQLQKSAKNAGRALGSLYGVNTAGAIIGALMTGWLLAPHIGTERTLYLGAAVNVALGVFLIPRFRWRVAGACMAAITLAAFTFPQWDMAAMTSGSYKYAPYYTGSVTDALHNGQMEFLREGSAGTVTVRQVGTSQVLAIDGKVDATDAGGDLLTEKLLAHLPLSLVASPRNVCVIGLASGVTAGAALTYPVERLDVLEVSKEVADASKLFERVNGRPLDSNRTRLILNDGRNHLALTAQLYDAILSEPSNPWISGMNSLFTRDFFRIARAKLKPGGVLAQWFHLYNMPPDDLRSLLRAFTEVFPSATLWQLNEGDVLLTGSAGDTVPHQLPDAAIKDLAATGVSRPDLLSTLYIMRGADLVRFAGDAKPNTDDWPVLEFHGLRDLDQQTDQRNMAELVAFPQRIPLPAHVREVREHMTGERLLARARMFEKAESYRLAFEDYKKANALAGMLRSARSAEERAAAGTMETRTTEALTDARNGDTAAAESLLLAVKEAWPERPETHLNYGVFCLERSRYDDAIQAFNEAIRTDPKYLPAYEAIAEAYMHKRDLRSAAVWSRKILDIDPNHESAKQALAALERQGVTLNPVH